MSRPAPRSKWLIRGAAALLVLAFGAIILWLIISRRPGPQWREVSRELTAMGFPQRQEDMWKAQPKPGSADPARMTALLKEISALEYFGSTSLARRPKDRSRQKSLLAAAGPALDEVAALAMKGPIRFPWDLDLGSRIQAPEAASLRKAGRLLLLRAHLRSQQKNWTAMGRDLAAARKAAGLLESLPTAGAMEGALGLGILRLQLIGRIAAENRTREAVLLALEQAVGIDDPGFDAKRAQQWILYRALADQRNRGRTGALVRDGWPRDAAAKAKLLLAAEDVMEAAIGWELSRGDLEGYYRWLRGFDGGRKRDRWSDRPIADPGARQLVVLAIQRRTWTKLVRTKLVLLNAVRMDGRAPARLEGSGAAEMDPFGRGLLKYRPAGRSFRLWSVGPDGKSQGGFRDDVVATD